MVRLPRSEQVETRADLVRLVAKIRDLVAANLIEAGERVLVLNSGYFGDSCVALPVVPREFELI